MTLQGLRSLVLCCLFFVLRKVNAVCLSSIDEDVVFVLDSSGSVSQTDWKKMLKFVSTLVTTALPQGTRVGEVIYGSYSTVWFGLDQFTNFDRISDAVENSVKYGGATYTGKALKTAQKKVFQASWDNDRVKKIVLVTDGYPSRNPCYMAPKLKGDNIKVIVVAVGNWIRNTNMNCLVNDPNEDIIKLGSFGDMEDNLGTVETVICANDFDLNIIEVQPYTGSGTPRFIEIYNLNGDMNFFGLELSGMYGGEIDRSTIIPQGNILLISEDSTMSSRCTTDCVFYHWEGSTDNYDAQDSDGTINEGFLISIRYDGGFIHKAEYTQNGGFPRIAPGHSFELLYPASNHKLGCNWRSSCEVGGSPGELPEDECDGCTDTSDCRSQGDTGASCDTANHLCTCSEPGYYDWGSSCLPLPTPSDCIVQEVSGADNRYYIDWTQPEFVDILAFLHIKIKFTLSGSQYESTLEEQNAPPTSNFAIDDGHRDEVRIVAVFNKSMGSYYTEELFCILMEAPTLSPSRVPSKLPTSPPTLAPILAIVPEVDHCELTISDNTNTDAEISWTYTGTYIVGGIATDPSGFVLRWGETTVSYFSSVSGTGISGPVGRSDIVLIASWNYTKVVATVTVEGYEDGAPTFSTAVSCSIQQATPSPTLYVVPAPEYCEVNVTVGGTTGPTGTGGDNKTGTRWWFASAAQSDDQQ